MELNQSIFLLLALPVFSISILLGGRLLRDIGH